MSEFKIIGLHGNIGAGKSTLALILQQEFNFRVISFSNPLKALIKHLFNIPDENLYGTQQQKAKIIDSIGVSARELCQKIGTEILRETIHDLIPNLKIERGKIWTWKMKQYIELLEYGNKIGKHNIQALVIDDVRFKNEIDMIHELKGKVIYIFRGKQKQDQHESEYNLADYCDYQINNNYSRKILEYSIKNILEAWNNEN